MTAASPPGDRPDFAILNGDLVPFAEARISVMAPGLTFAATVFEGLRAYWSEQENQLFVFRMDEHLERLRFSMQMLELAPPPDATSLAEAIGQVIRANAYREDCYIRPQAYVDEWGDMTATGPVGWSVVCRRRPRSAAFEAGKAFVVVSWRRNPDDASPPRIKAAANYLNGRLAGLEAERHGAGGAIILNRDGTVAEGPGGCLFMVRDGRLVTPPVTDGILESITRDTLLVLADGVGSAAMQRSIGRTELYLASELFYCGTGQEIVPILSVDGKPIGDGRPGPVTRSLQDRYDAVVRGREPAFRHWLTPVWS